MTIVRDDFFSPIGSADLVNQDINPVNTIGALVRFNFITR